MPFIVMKRSDIPAGTLQVLDLESNESQRNLIYDPPGQTKYVNPVKRQTPVIAGAGTLVTVGDTSGLEAYLLATLTDGGGASLTAAECVAEADAILDLLKFGDLATAAGDMDLATINGALTAGGAFVAADLPNLFSVLAGRDFVIPSGVQVETGGALAVLPAIGDAGGPEYGAERPTFDTSSLVLSVNTGKLSGFLRSDFVYAGVGGAQGEAVAVYNDDGTLY